MDIDRLQTMFDDGKLLRREWEDGHGRACAYVALYGPGARPEACPAGDMPPWLAHLIPWLDDAGSSERWPETIRRIVALLRRLPALDMEHVRHRWLAEVVREAASHNRRVDVAAVCERVIGLHMLASTGKPPSPEEWAAAAAWAAEAWAAARAAAWAAAAEAAAAEAAAADRMADKLFEICGVA